MDHINGLPAHPLFVHAPVVLMPLAMLATLAVAARPRWRQRYGPALAVTAFVVLGATFLATRSGEAFKRAVGSQIDVSHHQSLALTTRAFVITFFLGTVAYTAVDRFRRSRPPSWVPPAAWALSGITALLGILATVWMVKTGEAGARLVWDGVVQTIQVGSLLRSLPTMV